MKKTLLLCGVLLALAAPAFAQPYPPQIDLTWTDCVLGPTAVVDMGNACTNNVGSVGTMYAAFAPPGALPQYEANSSIVDLQTSAAVLSPWWHLEVGGCRSGSLSISGDFTTSSFACGDFWNGQALGGLNYSSPSPSFASAPNSARIQTAMAVQEALAGLVDNSNIWYAYKLTINRAKTMPVGCPGCLDGACIVLNEMRLSQPAPVPDVVLTTGPQQWVTYRGGAGTGRICPASTPSHSKTWGSVKALYR